VVAHVQVGIDIAEKKRMHMKRSAAIPDGFEQESLRYETNPLLWIDRAPVRALGCRQDLMVAWHEKTQKTGPVRVLGILQIREQRNISTAHLSVGGCILNKLQKGSHEPAAPGCGEDKKICECFCDTSFRKLQAPKCHQSEKLSALISARVLRVYWHGQQCGDLTFRNDQGRAWALGHADWDDNDKIGLFAQVE
jgi:hypothetical protein